MIPKVVTNELDGALGITPSQSGAPMVCLGSCASGTKNVPAIFSRVSDVTAAFTRGPAVEDACYAIQTYGKPVMIVRTNDTTPGACGAVTLTGQGTAAPTVTTQTSDGDYEIVILFVVGGALATTGITYRISYDAGRSYGPIRALGTALTITIPNSGGIIVTLGTSTQTILAGETVAFTAKSPFATGSDLQTALNALSDTAASWEHVLLSNSHQFTGTTDYANVVTWLSGMAAVGKHHWVWYNLPLPDYSTGYTAGETAYLTSSTTTMATIANTALAAGGGAAETVSAVNGSNYRAPIGRAVASLISNVSEEVDVAALNLGSLPGVTIRDSAGNPVEHDEYIRPGLDDQRVATLRTFPGVAGVYVNNPRLSSASGSDFVFVQHRRVMNLARATLNAFMARYLSVPLRVGPNGFVLESELRAIEAAANQMLRNLLLSKPKASSALLTLSRTDAVLQPPFPLTGQLRIQPLGYPKTITIDVGFTISAAVRSGV